MIDHHCHRVLADHTSLGLDAWRLQYTEASAAQKRLATAVSTVRYRRSLRRLANFYGVEESEGAVLSARSSRPPTELRDELFAAAGLVAVMYDDGYPPADLVDKTDDTDVGGVPGRSGDSLRTGTGVHTLQRIESVLDRAASQAEHLDELIDRIRFEWEDVRGNGHVGLKSAVAYRSGLVLGDWPVREVREAFAAHKKSGSTRVIHKPVCDVVTDIALRAAAAQGCPVQIHTGYGDEDVDLRLAHPLHVRQWVQREGFAGAPLVLLHGSFPYTAEAAYMASVYSDVHLDVSFGIPHTALGQLRAIASTALGQAPTHKVLYSSDAYCIPELHWMSAIEARQVTADVLDQMTADADISVGQAVTIATDFFAGNAERLYGLHTSEATAAPREFA